jgi:hypothetical protein
MTNLEIYQRAAASSKTEHKLTGWIAHIYR